MHLLIFVTILVLSYAVFFRILLKSLKTCSTGLDSGEYGTLYINDTLLILFIYSLMIL
jgi:hypothetical protein